MRAIDTNVLVRLIAFDDVDQAESARKFVKGGAWVSMLVLVEAVWVLKTVYERSTREISEIIAGLLQNESIALQDADTVAAALAAFRSKPAVGFSDFLILEAARRAGHLPLGTFDRALAKFDGAERVA